MKYFEAINPMTEESVRKKECDDSKKIEEKISLAQKAYGKWRKFSFEERAEVLNKVARLLRENKDAHSQMMTEEMGKPKKEADGEVEKAAWCAEHYAEKAKEYLQNEYIASDSEESYVQYDPLGVVLGILPWNAPYWLASRFYAPSLMAGNTCLMKPDPGVPGCGEEIEKVFKDVFPIEYNNKLSLEFVSYE
jgi:succinate-semialdehyde dehydrogenase/glutarate-semialdehyde dehydrogenase